MHEFNFKKKPMVKICGKEYEFDPSNNDLLKGIVENYPQILHIATDFQKIQRDLTAGKVDYQALLEKNKDLLTACKGFIIGCLGEAEYNEIFSQRKPNSTEHVELCTFLYQSMMEDREDVLKEYLGDESENDSVEVTDQT